MFRHWVCFGVLVSMTAVAGAQGPPKGAHRKTIEARADHVFAQADADHSGALDRGEQVEADPLAEKEIQKLLKDHRSTILAAVPEPKLADREAMTAAEFTQHFESLAGRRDATLRTLKIASRRPRSPGAPELAPSEGTNVGESDRSRGAGNNTRWREWWYISNPKREGKGSSPAEEPATNPGGDIPQPGGGGGTIPSPPGKSGQNGSDRYRGPAEDKIKGGGENRNSNKEDRNGGGQIREFKGNDGKGDKQPAKPPEKREKVEKVEKHGAKNGK